MYNVEYDEQFNDFPFFGIPPQKPKPTFQGEEFFPVVAKNTSEYVQQPVISRSQRRQKFANDLRIREREKAKEIEAQVRKFKMSDTIDEPTYTAMDEEYEAYQQRKKVLKEIAVINGNIAKMEVKKNSLKNKARALKCTVYPSNEDIKQEIEAKREAKRIREELRASRQVQLALEQKYEKELHAMCISILDGVTSGHDVPPGKLKDLHLYMSTKFTSDDYCREMVEVEAEELQDLIKKMPVEPQMLRINQILSDTVEAATTVSETIDKGRDLVKEFSEVADKQIPELQFTTHQVKQTVKSVDDLLKSESYQNTIESFDKISDHTQNVSKTLKDFNDLLHDEEYKSTLKTIGSVMENAETFEKISQSLNESVTMMKDLFNSFAPKTPDGTFSFSKILTVIVKAISTGLICYMSKESAVKYLAVLSMVTDVPFLIDLVKGIANWVFSSTAMKAQVLDENESCRENILFTLVKCIGSIFGARSLGEMKADSVRFSRVSNVVRFVGTFPAFLMSFKTMLVSAIHYVYEWMFDQPLVVGDDQVFNDKMVKFISSVVQLQDGLTSDRVKEAKWRETIKQLKKQRDEIDGLIASGQPYRHAGQLYMRAHSVVKVAYDEVLMFEKICHGRVPPLVLEFMGRPGTGKTALVQLLVAKLLHLLGRTFSGDSVYPRSTLDDFYSGYDHQFAILFDDYLQIQNKEGLQQIVSELFKIISPSPFALNMAEIEQKGKFFTSEMVLLTSNTRSGYNFKDVLGIQDGDAFAGRRNLVFQVEILDKETVGAWDHNRIAVRLVNPYTHVPVGRWMTFNQMLLVVYELYQERIANQANIVQYLMNSSHDDLSSLKQLASQKPTVTKVGNFNRSDKEGYDKNIMEFIRKVIPDYDNVTFDMDVPDISDEQFEREIRLNPRAEPFEPVFKDGPSRFAPASRGKNTRKDSVFNGASHGGWRKKSAPHHAQMFTKLFPTWWQRNVEEPVEDFSRKYNFYKREVEEAIEIQREEARKQAEQAEKDYNFIMNSASTWPFALVPGFNGIFQQVVDHYALSIREADKKRKDRKKDRDRARKQYFKSFGNQLKENGEPELNTTSETEPSDIHSEKDTILEEVDIEEFKHLQDYLNRDILDEQPVNTQVQPETDCEDEGNTQVQPEPPSEDEKPVKGIFIHPETKEYLRVAEHLFYNKYDNEKLRPVIRELRMLHEEIDLTKSSEATIWTGQRKVVPHAMDADLAPAFKQFYRAILAELRQLWESTENSVVETLLKLKLVEWMLPYVIDEEDDPFTWFEKSYNRDQYGTAARINSKAGRSNRVMEFLKRETYRLKIILAYQKPTIGRPDQYWPRLKHNLQQSVKAWTPIFLGVLGTLGALTAIVKIGQSLLSKPNEEEYEQEQQASHNYGNFRNTKSNKRGNLRGVSHKEMNHMYNTVRRMAKQDATVEIEGQMLNEDIAAKVQHNVADLAVTVNARERRLINGTFLFERSLITAAHFVDSILEFGHVELKTKSMKDFKRYPTDAIDIVEVPSTDLVMITFNDASLGAYKNIVRHIPPKDEYPCFLKDGITVVGRNSVLSTDIAELRLDQVYSCEGQKIVVPYGIFHFAGLPSGSCGRLYMNNDASSQYPIIGMHTAGNGVTSFGTVLFRELVEMMCSKELVQQMNTPEPVIDLSIINNCKGNEVIVVTQPQFAVTMSGKSEFVKSPLFDEDINTEVPGLLFPKVNPDGQVVKPLEQALIKKLKPEYTFEDPHFKQSVEIFNNSMPIIFEPRTLTLEEALNGIPEVGVLAGIEVKTSPGYPHNLPAFKSSKGLKGPGKADFITLHADGKRTATQRLVSELVAIEKEYQEHGTITSCIIQDTLKDEPLPMEKVFTVVDGERYYTGKTRIMGPLPIEHLVMERELFGAFFINILLWRKKFGFCDVGINPHSLDVDLMLKTVLPTQDTSRIKVIAGDISGIDGSIKITLLEAFENIVETFYSNDPNDTQRNKDMRKIYHRILAKDCYHIAGNVVYRTTSNPSGRFLTTVLNSVVVMLALMTTCLKKTGDKDKASQLLTKARVFGDDHVVFFEEDDMWFDMHDVEATMKILGMKYTGTDKTAALPKFYDFKDVKYLNRYFLKDERGFYHAACDKATIEQIGQWKPRRVPLEEWLPSIYSSVLHEAFHWGPKYFSERKRYLLTLIKARIPRFPPNLLNQLEYSDMFSHFTADKFSVVSSEMSHQMLSLSEDHLSLYAQSGKEMHVSDSVSNDDREDRSAVVATTDHQTILTDFADTVNNQTSDVRVDNVPGYLDGTDPYPDQNLQKVLSRMYPVASFDWQQSAISGTQLATFEFPAALRNNTTLARLNKFAYYRAGIEVSIRLNTTQFNSGLLLVSWIPHYLSTVPSFQKNQNVYQASCNNCMTVSANTQDTITFSIPYVAPSAYTVNSSMQVSDYHSSFGQVKIWVLCPLLNGMNISSSVGITVYARFMDAEVTGPVFLAQMNHGKGNVSKEQTDKSKDNLLSQIVSSAKKTVFTKSSKVLGNVLDNFADNVSIGSLFQIASGSLFDLPTTTKQVDRISVSSGSSFSFVKGLDNSTMLSGDPENRVATDHTIFNLKKDYDLFENYKRLPSIVHIGSFGQSALRQSLIYRTLVTPFISNINGDDVTLTHLANLASYFEFWRGDIQFMIHFVCNKFVSTRVRVEWVPFTVGSTLSDLEGDGNTINKVFDINGDTVVRFTVPYLAQKAWLHTATPHSAVNGTSPWLSWNGEVRVTIVNPISSAQADGVDPQVRFVVWVAGGDSFQVQYPRFMDSYEMKAQSGVSYLDPRSIFEEQFEGLIPCRLVVDDGLIHGEVITSFSELCKRYERVEEIVLNNVNGYQTIIPTYVEANSYQRYMRIHNTFLFSRGSKRYKIIGSGVAGVKSDNLLMLTTIAGSAQLDETGQQPLMVHYLGLNPVVEVQVPFNYTYALYAHGIFTFENEHTPYLAVNSLTQQDCHLKIFWAVGDDFKFGWPLGPGVITLLH